jgi:hypothetical protein
MRGTLPQAVSAALRQFRVFRGYFFTVIATTQLDVPGIVAWQSARKTFLVGSSAFLRVPPR